jgi:hypothetical protein
VSAYINQVDLGVKLVKFDSVQWLHQNVNQLLLTPDELHLHQAIFCGLPDKMIDYLDVLTLSVEYQILC